MRQRLYPRLAAVFVCVAVLICSLTGCIPQGWLSQPTAQQAQSVPFSEMSYHRPDTEGLYQQFIAAASRIEQAQNAEDVLSAYFFDSELLADFLTMSSLALIHSYMDATDSFYQQEVSFLQQEQIRLTEAQNQMNQSLLESEFFAEFSDYFSAEEIEELELQLTLSSPNVEEMLRKEQALQQQYSYGIATATVSVEGREYSLNDLVSMTDLSVQEYWELIDLYFEQQNEKLGSILVDLIELRHQLAIELGFDNFTELGYLRVGRTDYGQQEVALLLDEIEEQIAPFYRSLSNAALTSDTFSLLSRPEPSPNLAYEETVNAFHALFQEMSPETQECVDYLFDNGLYDFETRNNKDTATFTTVLYNYAAPFIFAHLTGYNSNDISSLTHEFGHALAYYYRLDAYGYPLMNTENDVAEIHSTAMEMLATHYYSFFYDEEQDIQTASRYTILEALENILLSAIYEEFNLRIYTELPDSVEEVNSIYGEVYDKYLGSDYSEAFDLTYQDRGWILITHFFDTPFYSIDYALAYLASLQIWERSLDDWNGAFEQYLDLLFTDDSYDYLALLEKCGLDNPFEEGVVKEVFTMAKQYLLS